MNKHLIWFGRVTWLGIVANAVFWIPALFFPSVIADGLDVHDPEETPANFLLTPDGLSVGEVAEALGSILISHPVAGLGIASYQPDVDPTGATAVAAVRLIELLGTAVSEA